MSRVRLTVLRTLRAVGGLTLIRRSGWRGRRLLILCYHGFSLADEHVWNPQLYVPGDHLAGRLQRLRRGGYRVLPLGEALERLYAGTLPAGAVALTVDDGFHDFHARAYPILKAARVPATVYASTYHVFDQRPIFNVACGYLLWKGGSQGRTRVTIGALGEPADLRTPGGAEGAAERLRALAARDRWSADRKHACLADLAANVGVDWEGFVGQRLFTLMTPGEIAGLDPGIADVQLHTHRHRMPDERELFLREVEDNRSALARCGRPKEHLTHFCYPSGVYAPHHLPWLAEAGVTSATTCEPGLASPRSATLTLPRFLDTHLTPEIEFDAWAAGVRDILKRPGWLRG